MTPHLACPMRESSQIGDARRQTARLGEEIGIDSVAAGRLAVVVTELATNLVRHATEGLLLIGRRTGPDGRVAIEVISIDQGPGMASTDESMTDGVSTFGSAGTGLGAVRRMSDEFFIFSKRTAGSVVVARIHPDGEGPASDHRADGAPSIGAICVAAPRETVSGDSWGFRADGERFALIVADGLGHGPAAADAADKAVAAFDALRDVGPKEIVETVHVALRSTRGAAVAAVVADRGARKLSFCGAGNVSARLISGVLDRSLMSQHGTAGLQVRRLQEVDYEWPAHALLVVHSDGIVSRWDLRAVPDLLGCDAIVVAAWLIRGHLRGRDDATVVVLRVD